MTYVLDVTIYIGYVRPFSASVSTGTSCGLMNIYTCTEGYHAIIHVVEYILCWTVMTYDL